MKRHCVQLLTSGDQDLWFSILLCISEKESQVPSYTRLHSSEQSPLSSAKINKPESLSCQVLKQPADQVGGMHPCNKQERALGLLLSAVSQQAPQASPCHQPLQAPSPTAPGESAAESLQLLGHHPVSPFLLNPLLILQSNSSQVQSVCGPFVLEHALFSSNAVI